MKPPTSCSGVENISEKVLAKKIDGYQPTMKKIGQYYGYSIKKVSGGVDHTPPKILRVGWSGNFCDSAGRWYVETPTSDSVWEKFCGWVVLRILQFCGWMV